MKKRLYKTILFNFIFTLQFCCVSTAQNLVNNPGFEIDKANPDNINELRLAKGWSNCNSSYGPTNSYGTPDLLSTLGSGNAQLPSSSSVYIYPHSGNCILGEILYDGESANYRQYGSTFLTSSLIKGQSYTVSFYASTGLSNQSGKYISNNLGILFSVDSVTQPNQSGIINRIPQINTNGVANPIGWEQYSFTFTADSAYNYLTIGNFYSDNATTLVDTFQSASAPYAFYYFDDFSVTPACDNPNLVNNPGFEIDKANPDNINELRLAKGWSNCNSSYGPTNSYGTPDLLSTLGSGNAQLPSSSSVYIYPHSGNCILGEILYDGESANYRQYGSTFLTSSLIKGQSYTVSFYASTGLSNQSGKYISNNLGILFSVDSVTQPNQSGIINRIPQINTNGVANPIGWEQYSFTFTADSAYNYLTIGNFYSDNATTLVDTFQSASAPYAFYYFDDFSVSEQCGSSEGINTIAQSIPSVTFYPDPVSDYATFDLQNLNTNNKLTFSLYNCLGQSVIAKNPVSSSEFIFNRGTFPAGIYFYQFKAENGTAVLGKMILN